MVGRLRMWAAVAALVAIAVLGTPQASHADFTVTVIEDGATLDTLHFTSPGTFNISKVYADFTLNGTLVESNAPGTNVEGDMSFSTVDVTDTSGSKHDINILLSDTFSNPGSAGETMTLGNNLTVVKQLAGSNPVALFSSLDGSSTSTVNFNGSNTPFAQSSSAQVFRANDTYTLAQNLDIKLAASGDIELQTDTSAAVPAPASMVMAFSALPFLGMGTWLRRRKMALLAP